MAILVELSPLNPATGTRVPLRFAAADDARVTGLNDLIWWPGIIASPVLRMDGWDGDFTGAAQIASASVQVDPVALRRVDPGSPAYRWAGAPLRVWQGDAGAAWADWVNIFAGLVEDYGTDEAGRYTFSARVDGEPFEANVLTQSYPGTGGLGGDADLKDKPRPMLFGRARSVEPVQINAVNLVYQVHGYGPIAAITAVYERAADFVANGGTNVGDFASYAALVAATIPEGSFGTCLSAGLFRLGAPPAGLVTVDVDGDNAAGFVRATASIINRLCTLAAVPAGRVDIASLNALNAAVPHPINLYLTQPAKLIDLIQSLARGCNAQAILSWTGALRVVRFGAIPSPAATLDAQGRQMPPVLGNQEMKVSPPYWRIEMRGARAWRAHGKDEIAFGAELIETGLYEPAATYREGNIVSTTDGSRWLFVATVPTSGNAPPVYPIESNAWWHLLSAPTDLSGVVDQIEAVEQEVIDAVDAINVGLAPIEGFEGPVPLDLAGAITRLTEMASRTLEAAGAMMLLQEDRKARTEALTHLDGIEIGTVVRQSVTELVEGQSAQAETIRLLGAVSRGARGFILDSDLVRVSEAETLAERFREISATAGKVAASITDLAATTASADRAFASTLTKLGALTEDGSAFVLNGSTAMIDPETSVASRFAQISVEFGEVLSAVIDDVTEGYADADTVSAGKLEKLGALTIDGTAFVLDGTTARVNLGGIEGVVAVADKFNSLSSTVGGNKATYDDFVQTQASTNLVTAKKLLRLGALTPDESAFVLDAATAIIAEPGGGYVSLAERVLSVSSEVLGDESSVQFLLRAYNGQEARAQLNVSVNGRITGFDADGATGLFDVEATTFRVGGVGVFEVTGGIVYINTARIANLTVGNLAWGAGGACSTFYDNFGLAVPFTAGDTTTWTKVGAMTITPPSGSPVEGYFSFAVSVVSGGATSIRARIIRRGGGVDAPNAYPWSTSAGTVLPANGFYTVPFKDSIGAGVTQTYELEIRTPGGNTVQLDVRQGFLEEKARARFQDINVYVTAAAQGPGVGSAGGGNINGVYTATPDPTVTGTVNPAPTRSGYGTYQNVRAQ